MTNHTTITNTTNNAGSDTNNHVVSTGFEYWDERCGDDGDHSGLARGWAVVIDGPEDAQVALAASVVIVALLGDDELVGVATSETRHPLLRARIDSIASGIGTDCEGITAERLLAANAYTDADYRFAAAARRALSSGFRSDLLDVKLAPFGQTAMTQSELDFNRGPTLPDGWHDLLPYPTRKCAYSDVRDCGFLLLDGWLPEEDGPATTLSGLAQHLGIIVVALARGLPAHAALDADQLIRVEDTSDTGAAVHIALNQHGPTGRFPIVWNSVTRQAIAQINVELDLERVP